MSVYGSVADAILIVFCIDEEIQSGKGKLSSKAPQPLKEFMNNVDADASKN